MNRDISKEQQIFADFVSILGGWGEVSIHRADGSVEGPWTCKNQVTAVGLNELAARSITANSRSPFNVLNVGSGTSACSLGSTALTHLVNSKSGAVVATSKSLLIISNTWGGAADGITSVALEEAGIFNQAGVMLNGLTGVSATLGDSDTLSLAMLFRIGSHNL